VKAATLPRLSIVELRKAADTRAGYWLIAVVGALTVAVVGARLASGTAGDRTLGSLVGDAQLPVSVLLPVLGVLAVTSEWSQRTGLYTFSLVPARGRVVAAKLLATSLLAGAAWLVAVAVGVAGFAAGQALHRTGGGWHLAASTVGQLGLVDWVTMLCGTAFGLLVLHSAPAVATFYVVPIGWSALGRLVPGLAGAAGWLDLGRARVPLVDPGVTGPEWARFLTASLLWVAVPALLGVVRVHRTDIG
jgi:ABC-2 type transport system permease protein